MSTRQRSLSQLQHRLSDRQLQAHQRRTFADLKIILTAMTSGIRKATSPTCWYGTSRHQANATLVLSDSISSSATIGENTGRWTADEAHVKRSKVIISRIISIR
jgi:hypothetical protein